MQLSNLLLFIFFLAVGAGCASVNYHSQTGETFDYKRLGVMKLDGFELNKGADGSVIIKFNKSESGMGDLAEAVKNLTTKIP